MLPKVNDAKDVADYVEMYSEAKRERSLGGNERLGGFRRRYFEGNRG